MKKSGQCRSTPRQDHRGPDHSRDRTRTGPQKYVSNFSSGLAFFSAISLGPYLASRFPASPWLRPPSGDDDRRFSTSGTGRDFRSSFASGTGPGPGPGAPGRLAPVSLTVLIPFSRPPRHGIRSLPQPRRTAAGHISRGREPGHRSVVTLELTATGQHLVSQAATWREQELARILRRLPPAGRRQVTTALRQLVEAAGEGYGTISRGLVPV